MVPSRLQESRNSSSKDSSWPMELSSSPVKSIKERSNDLRCRRVPLIKLGPERLEE
ncbi:hypothetical protein LOK49_LG12G02199 [Camellia lanceoleosa]|uniref:Uncharacterized protein n=1 Tax=Camellia lanceoleosa TaxID=1840588 RepID=A0ACC0FW54_9ERIC|nr:hypothetical protein LOK49_LG12G02199 [Camellia lanceoleosa]